ncbi:MAG: HDOD domain-containing protein [Deltaproteobacteria bacterium]|nr:HDOD domain-containing protein [Deltaproteobacteria bacterium]
MALSRDKILAAVKKADSLPSVPDLIMQLEKELRKPHPSIAEVTKIIEQDPSLSANLLRITNSAFYRRTRETTTVRQAMMRLGFEEVRRMATAAVLVDGYKGFAGGNPKLYWGHCMAVSLACRAVAEFCTHEFSKDDIELVFTAGLLHDLGVLALYHLFPKEYAELMQTVLEKGGIAHDAEVNAWDIDHGEVGEVLTRRWKLPEPICQVARFHHRPWLCADEHRSLIWLVHISNFICNNQGYGRKESGFPDAFDHGAWDALGLSLNQVPEIIEKVQEEGERSATFINAFN